MQDAPYSRSWLIRHVRLAILGVITGFVAVAFRLLLDHSERIRPWLMDQAGGGILALGTSILYSLLTIGLAVWLVARFCPEASGSGIPQVKALARHPESIRWFRLLIVKFTGGLLGIGGGLALGREGPTVQMGTALGEMFHIFRGISAGERRQLLILGAGAGLAGAFNAPLAGALFIFEELNEEFRSETCLGALLATFGADLVCREFSGQYPQLGAYPHSLPPLEMLPYFLLLGWCGGVCGVLFNQSLHGCLRIAAWLRTRRLAPIFPLCVAVLIGITGWLHPRWVGGGHEMVSTIRAGEMTLHLTLVLLLLRSVLTITSYATGAAGGLFAPLLLLGALLGQVGSQFVWPSQHHAMVIVGMGALFTGIVRAPVTAIVLMIEMTGAYTLVVPLMGACLMAKLMADALGDTPIYEALLEESRREAPVRPERPESDLPV